MFELLLMIFFGTLNKTNHNIFFKVIKEYDIIHLCIRKTIGQIKRKKTLNILFKF